MKSTFVVLLNEMIVTDALQVMLPVFCTIWLERMAVVCVVTITVVVIS